MLGVGLAATVLASAFSRHRRTVVAISVAMVVLLSVRTAAQLTTWRTTRTLFEHVLQVNPASWGAYNSLAEDALQNNEDARAADLAAKGLAFAPDYAELHVTLGTVAARKGDLDRAL